MTISQVKNKLEKIADSIEEELIKLEDNGKEYTKRYDEFLNIFDSIQELINN